MITASLEQVDPEVFGAIYNEAERLEANLELIASENVVSEAVLEAQGCLMTNKYAEGYPGKRYYGGCEYVDVVERLSIERAKDLFWAEHVNVHARERSSKTLLDCGTNAIDVPGDQAHRFSPFVTQSPSIRRTN